MDESGLVADAAEAGGVPSWEEYAKDGVPALAP